MEAHNFISYTSIMSMCACVNSKYILERYTYAIRVMFDISGTCRA